MYQETDHTKASFAAYKSALDAAKAAMEADDSSNYEYEQLRIALEAGVRGLVLSSAFVINEVTVSPQRLRLPRAKPSSSPPR